MLIWYKYFEKNWSQNSKMVESSRLFSSGKKKSKRSKLAGAAVYWTNFKAEWKKRISLHHKLVKWCWPVGDIIKTAFCINFLCFHQIWSNPATIMDKVFETNPSFHVAHYGKCPIWNFQEFVASTDRNFILGGRLGTGYNSMKFWDFLEVFIQQLLRQRVYTFGKKKSWWNIKVSQNIMTMNLNMKFGRYFY